MISSKFILYTLFFFNMQKVYAKALGSESTRCLKLSECERMINTLNVRYYNWTHWELGKIQAPDGIPTHNPPWSSTDALTIELLETLWWARVKCGYLTRAASSSHNDALSVTARCSYELCCQTLFDSVGAWCRSSQRPTFHPCSP